MAASPPSTPPSIPISPDDLTPEWVETTLVGRYDVSVRSVSIRPIGTGQMANSLRIELDYEHRPEGAPDSVVVKIASTDPNSRAAGARGAYLKEVRFYQQLAASLEVSTPASHFAAIDAETNDFAIVLEDMQPARQGDQIAGCSAEQVLDAARNIAGLHAPSWGDESLLDLEWLIPKPAERAGKLAELKGLVAMVTPGFIDRYQDRIDHTHIELLRWFSEVVDEWVMDDRGIFALMHGDHRLDNLLFAAAEPKRPVTVVDWQTLAVRNPLADISYLLGTSVDPELRRDIEHEVVAEYHSQLLRRGVDGYSAERCFEDYRSQTPHSLLLCVLGSMLTVQTDRGDDMFMAMLHRSCQQMVDLGIR